MNVAPVSLFKLPARFSSSVAVRCYRRYGQSLRLPS